jgi:single-strand DNA-binding protein
VRAAIPREDESARVVMEMANENQVMVVGNLTDDPELRYTPNGAAVANFRVAVSRRVKDDATGQWKDAETSFFRVNAWRSLGENVAESLTRGARVVVVGRLRSRSWETPEGETRSATEIEADEIGPSLRWATAKVEKTQRSSGGGGGDWSENVTVGATSEEPAS